MKFKRPSTRPLFKNPLAYRDGWKCEWSRGHRLDKIENSGYNVNVTFKYDENGIRNQKVVNGVQTDFITSGIKLLGQKTGENVLLWQVDGNDNTIGFNYNNIPYFYMKNLQGDIVGITDASGNIVAKYTYDSWGKLISIKDASDVDKTTDTTFIGYINPLRYRGYYYDFETGLYYLNARYYDPEVNRFISADETLDGGYNLFEYCGNNPVSFADCSGHDLEEAAIARVLECAGELATRSFGKAPGGQWEYSSLVYNLEGTWHSTPPRTDHNATEVHEFEDMGSLTLSFAKGRIKTVIGVHTHEVVAQKTRDGSVVWLYDPGFSTPKSVGGVEKSNDITSNRRAFEVFQKRGVRYYAAVVLADGNVLLHDVGENRIYKIGNVAPDPNIRYCKAPSVKGKSTTDDPCIVM